MTVRVRPLPGFSGHHWAWADLSLSWSAEGLSPLEQALAAQIPPGRRRTEFVAGRWAAHHALAAWLHPVPPVGRSAEGAPRLVGDGPPTRLSISHSRTAAVAAAGPGPGGLGIDLMDPADGARIPKVLGRFQSQAEARLLRGPEGPFVAWGAREAVAKATETGMFRFAIFQVHVTDFDPSTGKVDVEPAGMQVRWMTVGGHHVVVADASPAAVQRAKEQATGP